MAENADALAVDLWIGTQQVIRGVHVSDHPVVAEPFALHRDIGFLWPPMENKRHGADVASGRQPVAGIDLEGVDFQPLMRNRNVLKSNQTRERAGAFGFENQHVHGASLHVDNFLRVHARILPADQMAFQRNVASITRPPGQNELGRPVRRR